MKRRHQGYNARLDESLGARHPHHKYKESIEARRHESEGMERHYRPHHPYASVHTMDKALHKKLAAAHHRTMADHLDGKHKKKESRKKTHHRRRRHEKDRDWD